MCLPYYLLAVANGRQEFIDVDIVLLLYTRVKIEEWRDSLRKLSSGIQANKTWCEMSLKKLFLFLNIGSFHGFKETLAIDVFLLLLFF